MPDTIAQVGTRQESPRNRGGPSWGRWVVVGAAAIVLAVTLVAGVNMTANSLALLFAAIVIAEAICPLIDRMERWMPRGVAVIGIYSLLIGTVIGALWFVIPDLGSQARNIASQIPEVADEVTDTVDEVTDVVDDESVPVINDVESSVRQAVSRFTSAIADFSTTLVTSVAQIVLVGFMSAYWLMSRSSLFGFIRSLAPKEREDAVSGTLDALSETVGGYVRGVAISAVMVGVLAYAGLMIIGVEYALVLALIAGFGEFLPIVGPIITAVPAVVVALFDSPTQALIVAVLYLILQQVESNIITPNVMSNQADVPPLMTIVAITAGGSIGGILGALIAIPFAGVIKVMVTQVAAPGIRRWTGANDAPTTVEQAQQESED